MPDTALLTKLQAWVDANPESADEPFINVDTGQEFTVRGLLNILRDQAAGKAIVDDEILSEVSQIEKWIEGI